MLHQALAPVFSPLCIQTRNMATLKDISMRLKSIKSIQKITKSMKMVSAAKFAKAERELRPARSYGSGAQSFFAKIDAKPDETKPNHLFIAITSDRGLCGGVHSSVVKAIKSEITKKPKDANLKVISIGDKARGMLQRQFRQNLMLTGKDFGRMPPTFADASTVAQAVLDSGFDFDNGTLFYNRFKNTVSYKTTQQPILSLATLSQAEKLSAYDSVDEEVIRSYNEFALASLVYYGMKEGAASEQSQRMTAMDSASKNAGEIIGKLTLTYNRTRQAVITRELIEIISGASALA